MAGCCLFNEGVYLMSRPYEGVSFFFFFFSLLFGIKRLVGCHEILQTRNSRTMDNCERLRRRDRLLRSSHKASLEASEARVIQLIYTYIYIYKDHPFSNTHTSTSPSNPLILTSRTSAISSKLEAMNTDVCKIHLCSELVFIMTAGFV
jgi:hypothetical protein